MKKFFLISLFVGSSLMLFNSCEKNDEVSLNPNSTIDNPSPSLKTTPVYSSLVGQCTAGMRLVKGGYTKSGRVYGGVPWNGDAYEWYSNASNSSDPDVSVGSTPRVGAIIVWGINSSKGIYLGHVGVLTKKVNGVWYYRAMNDSDGKGNWSYRKVSDFHVTIVGYIYYKLNLY